MEPLRELDLAVKAEDPEELLPNSTAMSGMDVEDLLSETNRLTPDANGGGQDAVDENGLVSLRGASFRWSSAGEHDKYTKTFKKPAGIHNKRKKRYARVGAKTSEKLAGGKAKVG